MTAARRLAAYPETDSADELRDALAKIENLRIALTSNRRIGMAVGILMAYHRVTDEDAVRLLVSVSQAKHVKVRDVADLVIEAGALP